MTSAEKIGQWALLAGVVALLICTITMRWFGHLIVSADPGDEPLVVVLCPRSLHVFLLGLIVYVGTRIHAKRKARKQLTPTGPPVREPTTTSQVAKWAGVFSRSAFLVALVCVFLAFVFLEFSEGEVWSVTGIATALAAIVLLASVGFGYVCLLVYAVTSLAARAEPPPITGAARLANWSSAVAITAFLSTLTSGILFFLIPEPGEDKKVLGFGIFVALGFTALISLLACIVGFLGYVVGRIAGSAKSEG